MGTKDQLQLNRIAFYFSMKKAFKLLAFAAFTFLLFLVVSAAAFYHLISVGEFRRFLISEIEQNTELKVGLGEAELQMGRILGIAFRDVAISEPDAPQPAITAERITARVALLPLFRRRIVFYEVYLQKPIARVERNKEGKLPLIDRLLNLSFLKSDDAQFGFDLRQIKIVGGEIDLQDHFREGPPVTTYLRELDLKVGRIRGKALREFFQKVVRAKRGQLHGTALQFDLNTGVARDGQATRLRAQGTMVFPGDKLEIEKAWWNAKMQVTGMPAPMVQSFAAGRLPVQSARGSMDSSMQVEGNPNERLHLQGEIVFKEVSVDAPEVFPAPLDPGDGRIAFEFYWQPKQWEFPRFELRSKDLKLALRAIVRAAGDRGNHLQLSLTSAPLPILIIRKYLPTKWLAWPQLDGLVFQEGELQIVKAGVNADLSELSGMVKTGFDERIWFDGEVRHLGMSLAAGYLPLRRVQGRIALEKGVLSFKSLSGDYGQSHFTNVDGSYRFSPAGRSVLEVRARGEVDLAELREQAKQGVLAAQLAKVASSVQEIGGKGRLDVAVTKAAEAAPQVEGAIVLDGAHLQLEGVSLSEIRGELAVTPAEIKAERVRALIAGSPVQMQLTLKDYAADNGSFDFAADSTGIRAGIVTRLLLDSGSLQDPGIVRGSIHYQGPLASREGRKFTGNLDLTNVQLMPRPLLQPLRELNGKIKIDEAGIDFQNLKGLLVGSPASFNGRWRFAQKPQLLFDFAAPNLDVIYLLSQIDPEATDFYANLEAEGKMTIAKGRIKGFEFSDFNSAVGIYHRVWRFSNPTMQSAGGSVQGEATIVDKPDLLSFSLEPKIQGVPVPSFLRWFDISNSEITGKVNLTGHVDTMGKSGTERKKNLNGTFNLKIEDGTIRRLRVVVQLLNLLDLSRWFTFRLPDLNKEGIRFRRISGDFKVTKGVYATENLLVDSDDLRITGSGKIDVPGDEIDFVVAVRPFAGIDTGLNYIPLIGTGIAAIKNSFLVASFNIKGSIEDPTITPAPLGTLSEWFWGVLGIPKKIISFPGAENN
jgi:uncharacterized protein YhdP